MSTVVAIDVLEVARRIVADPRRVRVSVLDELAMAQWIIAQCAGDDAPPEPGASLSAAVARVILARDAFRQLPDRSPYHGPSADRAVALKKQFALDRAFEDALDALQTLFEKEFPDGTDQD